MEEKKMDVLANVGIFSNINSTQMVQRVLRDEKNFYCSRLIGEQVRERVLRHLEELEKEGLLLKKEPEKDLESPLEMTKLGHQKWISELFAQ